jgi:hypothetical protein
LACPTATALLTARAGGKRGLFLQEFAEGRGRLILFFSDEHSSAETRFHFEEFIMAQSREGLARIAQRFNARNQAQHGGKSRKGRKKELHSTLFRPYRDSRCSLRRTHR